MMTANKILAVSFIAMLAVSTANATVVTQTNIVGSNGVGVGVVAVDGVNKVQIKGPGIGYAASSTAAATAAKTATVDGITSLEKGQIVVITPSTTSTATSCTLNVNSLGAKDIYYKGAPGNCKTVWVASTPAIFIYDGTRWQYAGHGVDNNTTYTAMTTTHMNAETLSTTSMVVSPANLKIAVEKWAPETDISGKQDIDNMETSTTSFDETSTTKYPSMAVAQAMIDKSADDISDVVNNKQNKLTSTGTGANVVAGTATGNVVTSITASDGTVTINKASGAIKNVDVASDAAIAVSKINGAEATANKSTSTNAVADSTGSSKDTKYPTVAGAKAIADAAVSGAAGNYATAAQGGKADTALQSVTANSNSGVVTNISKSGTAVTMTKALIKNADVASDAAIAVSKISGAEASANKSTSTNAVADSTGSSKDTKYPTVAGAKAIADAAVSGAAGNYATAAQGALADSAVQSVTTGSANGTIAVDGTDVSVKGLGTAAYTASTAYATSAQGGKADTALQSVTANSNSGVVTNISKSGTAVTMTKAQIKNADVASDAAIAVSKISGAEASANKSTSTNAVADSTGSSKDTKYPTVAGAKAIADAAVSGAAGNYATAAQGGKADTALQSVTANSNGGVVTNISKSGTAITMTKAKIANADVADNAAIAVSKISGAEASANKVANMSDLATADYTSTTKYPSIKTTVELIEDSADTLSDEISTLSNGKQDKLKSSGDGANVTSSGTGYVVTGVTANNGVVTVSKANVQIPSGSETATTYASIWVE